MEEREKLLRDRINELKSRKSALEAEAASRAWTRNIGYFLAGWNFYKLITKRSTLLSNIVMAGGFIAGHNASRDINNLNCNVRIIDDMIEEREQELRDFKDIKQEQEKQNEERAKILTLQPIESNAA